MEYLIPSLWFALGIALIIKGGDWFVDAAGWIAEVSGIPKFIVGATVVSFATTMPEIIASLVAAAGGNAEIAIGNAVGSVTANTGLIMGISVCAIPMVIDRRKNMPKMLLLLLSVGALWALCATGTLSVTEGYLLLAIVVAFLIENVLSARRDSANEASERRPKPAGKVIAKNVIMFIVGAAGIVVGANLLVDNGAALASLMGIPDAVIAATLIAIGTSLPELVTTLTAIRKKQASLSIGNIVGANIIDLTLILPASALVYGSSLPISTQGLSLDLPFCAAVTAIAVVPTIIMGRFRRWQGALLLAVYAAYLVLMLINL